MAKRNDHGYVPIVRITIWSFPHSKLITRFVTRVKTEGATCGAETA